MNANSQPLGLQRILKEFKRIQEGLPYGVNVFQDPSDSTHLIATLRGPLGSSYENGFFIIDVKYPVDYPYKPPGIRFCTKVWHPNVSPETGRFCMDLLSNSWSPLMYLEKFLVLVQSFLDSPLLTAPEDAVNPVAAEMFRSDPTKFQTTAKEWTERYAASSPPTAELVGQWLKQPPFFDASSRAGNMTIRWTTPVREFESLGQYRNFTDPVLDPPVRATGTPSAPVALPSQASTAPTPPPAVIPPVPPPAVIPPVPPHMLSIPSAPLSWLALLLEGRTTPAFISLCEEKLIQQEDFSSAELLAMVPESEFTCEYLTSIGITAKGLQVKLVNLHKELRAVHGEEPSASHSSRSPAGSASTELATRLATTTLNAGGDRALDPVQNFRWLISAHRSESKFKPIFSSNKLHPMTGGRLEREIEVINGPVDSPYESRYFKLDVQCPPNYPFKACRIKFCTEVWHPNVDRDGSICSAMLQEDWSPAYTLHKCLIVIQSMLHTPVVSKSGEAVNFSAAMSFLHDDHEYYDRMVRFMTEAHGLVAPPTEEEVAQWFAAPSQTPSFRRIPLFDIPLNPLHGSVPPAAQPLPAEAKRGGFFGFRPFSSSRPQVHTTEQAQVARKDPSTDARTLAPTAPLGPTSSAHQDLLKGSGNKK
eukprot:gene18014-20521_t